MSMLQQVEEAVAQLSPEELQAFRAWFAVFDVRLWDRQLEEDVREGRFDALTEEALRELSEGR